MCARQDRIDALRICEEVISIERQYCISVMQDEIALLASTPISDFIQPGDGLTSPFTGFFFPISIDFCQRVLNCSGKCAVSIMHELVPEARRLLITSNSQVLHYLKFCKKILQGFAAPTNSISQLVDAVVTLIDGTAPAASVELSSPLSVLWLTLQSCAPKCIARLFGAHIKKIKWIEQNVVCII